MQAHQTLEPQTTAAIRPIRREDNPAVAAIIRRVLPSFGLNGAGCAASDPELDSMYETYSQPGSAYFVAEDKVIIVGGGGVAPLKGGAGTVCELQKMYLLQEARGNGMGYALLKQCLDAAKKLGFARCYLETFQTMHAAQALYHKCGFTPLPAPMGSTGHYQCTHWYIKEL